MQSLREARAGESQSGKLHRRARGKGQTDRDWKGWEPFEG